MYRDPILWKRVRTRILVDGDSPNHVAITEGLSRATVRRILRHKRPVGCGGKIQSEDCRSLRRIHNSLEGKKAKELTGAMDAMACCLSDKGCLICYRTVD